MTISHNMKALLLSLVCALFISTGQVLWKVAIDRNGGLVKQGISLVQNFWGLFTSPYMLIGLFVYLVATVLWMYLLGEYEYSYIYPMISLVYVFGFAYSKWLFREEINLYRWIGVALIIAGVVIVNRKG
jgi:drug/metabolite transporter (DMT)-like permease